MVQIHFVLSFPQREDLLIDRQSPSTELKRKSEIIQQNQLKENNNHFEAFKKFRI